MRLKSLLLAILLSSCLLNAQTQGTPGYTFTIFDVGHNKFISGRGINDSGVVAGDAGGHAFVGNPPTIISPPNEDIFGSRANGISNSGQIVGIPDFFRDSGGSFDSFGGKPVAINNAGQVLLTNVSTNNGFLSLAICTLPIASDCFAPATSPFSQERSFFPFGFNKSGVIVGQWEDFIPGVSDDIRGFVGAQTIDEPDASPQCGRFTQVTAINDAGDFVGNYIDANCIGHGFFKTNSSGFVTIDPPNSTYTESWGINNKGQITGWFQDEVFQVHAYIATPQNSCQVNVTSWKQFTGSWATSSYDQSYRTVSFSSKTAPVSPNGNLFLSDGIKSCSLTLDAAHNNLSGLVSFINTRCRGMNAFGPSQDGNGEFYDSIYNTRCLSNLTACPRSSTGLHLFTNLADLSSNILSPKTMTQEGCALTTLAMALDFAKVDNLVPPPLNPIPLDPGNLNDFMSHALSVPGGLFDNQGNVQFDDTVRIVASNSQKLSLQLDKSGWGLRSTNTPNAYDALDAALCADQPHPVIVGVKMDKNGTPGHFVLVTGKLPNTRDPHPPGGQHESQYQIEDSGKSCPTSCTLDKYVNNNVTDFVIRGFVKDPIGDVSALNVTVDDAADILVTDATGLQTGFDPTTGEVFQGIPGSGYSRDSSDNNDTGIRDTGTAHSVLISTPAPGNYEITISGLAVGSYTLLIRPYGIDGTLQQIDPIMGIAGVGSTSTFRIQFSSALGTSTQIARVSSFQSALDDIHNSLQIGLIDNEGVANSLSKKIEHAANAAGNERVNTLNAFMNEVRAQASKHITGISIQVLSEDGQSLINQAP